MFGRSPLATALLLLLTSLRASALESGDLRRIQPEGTIPGPVANADLTTASARHDDNTDGSIRLLIDRLAASSGEEALDVAAQLGVLGPAAHEATALLVAKAHTAPWDDRPAFFRIIGLVGDGAAVEFLTTGLDSGDWRVVVAATVALAHLGTVARSAAPALARVARTYWLPRERRLASFANNAVVKSSAPRDPPSELLGTLRNLKQCKPPISAGWKSTDDVTMTTPPKGVAVAVPGRDRFVIREVDGGMLVGTNRGHYGGEFLWVHDGRQQILSDDNVIALIQRPWGLVLLQGVSDMRVDRGRVSIVEKNTDGLWVATPILELPGGPFGFREEAHGGLNIATTRGTVMLDRRGRVRAYECRLFS